MRFRDLAGLCLVLLAPLAAQAPLAVSGLPAASPLAITARATPELLVVDLVLKPEWHVYARDVGGGQPVAVRLVSDCGFVAAAPLRLPPDVGGKLTGNVRLELPLAARGASTKLSAVVDFMVCDALECLPPISVEVSGDVALGAERAFLVLLVVDQKDEHSARIRSFLETRRFEAEVATYADVTEEQCERAAVVLADSKLFGQGAKVRQQVLKFPRTKTPIVAVGFFGTELIEAHADAKALGTPNRERASLRRWIALAEQGDAEPEQRARAQRCLQRYVHASIAPNEQGDGGWSRWYAEYAERFVFIESTGFWWQLDPTLAPVEAAGRR